MSQAGWELTARRLMPFFALSLLLHFVLLRHWQPPMPETPSMPTLTAQLQSAPSAPISKRFFKPRHRNPRRHIHAVPSLDEAPLPKPIVAVSSTVPPTVAPAADENDVPSAVGTDASFSPATTQRDPPVTAPRRSFPPRGEIRYTLYYGDAGWIVGDALQTWDIDGVHYRFTSRTETAGILGLFSHQHVDYESEGDITAEGFRPAHFTVDRRRSGIRERTTADFDWNAMSVTLDTPPRTVPLNPDAQDMLSFMYELGLKTLRPGRLELPITNGWKFERYQIDVGVEESIDTPIGKLKTVPMRQVVPRGTSSVELWLATDYRMLPVRILFYGNDGRPSGEQIVSAIRVSSE